MARKVYVGAPKTEVVTSNNVSSWFTFSDTDGISSWNGTTLTVTGVSGNERVKFTALQDMTVSFDYDMDSFCKISFNGKYICEEGDSGSYTATLAKGKSFYISNSSAISAQTSTFTNITCTTNNPVARKVKKMYAGVSGVTREVKKGYVGVEGVARLFYQISGLRFKSYFTGVGYGTNIARQEGTSLYLEASGTAPYGTYISSYYMLKDADGYDAYVKSGTKIVLSVRTSANNGSHTLLFRGWKNGKSTVFYNRPNITDATYTLTSDYDLIEFVVEVGNGGSSSDYAKLWIDRFEINGEKVV